MKHQLNITLTSIFLWLLTITASGQKTTSLVNFGEGANSKNEASFAYHNNLVYILYVDDVADNSLGGMYWARICRYNMVTGAKDWSGNLFHTLATNDSKTNDESHNGSAITVDGDGYIHVWIGMHNHKMKYYRSISSGSFNSFGDFSTTMPGYNDKGLDEKRYTYPAAATTTNGDVFVILRRTGLFINSSGLLQESQHNEKQDLYHWNNTTNVWTMDLVKKQDGRNAYMSSLYADNNNNLHIVTAWSQLHSGDNTFQKGTYLKYDVSRDKYYKADGVEVNTPIDVATIDADKFYPGEEAWGDAISEIQTPQVTVNGLGNPVVMYPYNIAPNFSQTNPNYVVNVAMWNGSSWTRVDDILSESIQNHDRPPITYTGGMVNIFSWNVKYIGQLISSLDNGANFGLPVSLLGAGNSPVQAHNYNSNTDLYINKRELFSVVYPTLGITSTVDNGKTTLYPNPSDNVIYFKLDIDYKIADIEIVNVLGQTVLSNSYRDNQKIKILIDNLSSGQYIINASIDGAKIIKKITKE